MARLNIAALRDKWERLSQRERTMVSALGVSFVVMFTLIFGFIVTDGLSTLEERNAAMRQALRDLDTQRDSYLKAKAKTAQIEARLGHTPIQLEGYLETVAKETGVEIPESSERPPVAAGKNFVERSVDIHLRKVQIEQLAKFLRRIETGPNLVVVTALSVSNNRDDKHQEFDVDMTVATYEHDKKDVKPKNGKDKENG